MPDLKFKEIQESEIGQDSFVSSIESPLSLDGFKESSEEALFQTGSELSVRKEIEKVEDKTREEYTNLTGDEYPTEIEKKDRISEIDFTINRLKEKQKTIAEREEPYNPYSESMYNALSDVKSSIGKKIEINKLSKQIKLLSNERNNLDNEVRPITKEEIKDVEDSGYGLYADFDNETGDKYSKLKEKYSESRLLKIYKTSIDEKFNNELKQRLQFKTPDNILSYNNIINGESEPLNQSYAEQKDLDSIMYKASLDPKYKTTMHDEKRKLIYSQVKKHLATKEGVEDKEGAASNIMNNILQKFAFGEDGNLTVEGVKMYAEYMLEKVNTMLQYNESSMNHAAKIYGDPKNENYIGSDEYRKIRKGIGKENADEWYDRVGEDLLSLGSAKKFYEKILSMPEARNGIKDLGKSIKSLRADEFLLGLPELADNMELLGVAKRAEKGENLSYGEELMLQGFATLNFAKSYGTEGKAFKITRGTALMLPYVAEFAMTGGTYTAAKEATMKGTSKILRSALTKTVGKKTADFATLNIGRLVGTGAQTIALPQMWLSKTAENMTPDVVLDPQMNDIKYKINENTGDNVLKGFTKGFTSAYVEMFFERSGQYLTKFLPTANQIGKKVTGKDLMQNKFIQDFMNLKGVKNVTSLYDNIANKKLGWDGIFEEYLEEFGTYAVDKKLSGENIFQGNKNFWEDQLVTLGTVALFGGLMKGTKFGTTKLVGDKKVFTTTNKDGESKEITVPNTMYNEFVSMINKRDDQDKTFLNADAYDEFMTKWEGKMNKDQVILFTQLAINEGEKLVAKNIESKYSKKKEKRTDGLPEDFDPNILGDIVDEKEVETIQSNLTPEEKSEINQANDVIKNKYPDLANNGLILKDVSGQYIEPTKKSIDHLYRIIASEISQLERDEKGDYKNLTPENETLVKQLEILEGYKENLKDKETPFEELSVEQKQERLLSELKENKQLKATVKYVAQPGYKKSGTGLTLKLEDGRTIKAYINPTFSEEKKDEIRIALKGKNKNVELIRDSWQNWNEWDEQKEEFKYLDKNDVPYWDAIRVSYNGEIIGNVEVTDFRKKNIVEEKKEEIKEEISKGIEDIFGSMVVEKPTEEVEDNSVGVSKVGDIVYDNKGQEYIVNSIDKYGIPINITDNIFGSKISIDKVFRNKPNNKKNNFPSGISDMDSKLKNINKFNSKEDAFEYYNNPSLETNKEFRDFIFNFLEKNNIELNQDYLYQEIHNIIGYIDSPILDHINKQFSSVFNQLNTKIKFVEKTETGAAKYLAYTDTILIPIENMSRMYAVNKQNKYINNIAFTPEIWLKKVFMHESTHAYTSLKILAADNRNEQLDNILPILNTEEVEAIDDLKRLFNYVKENSKDVEVYGFKDLQEFVAEAFSNPSFMKLLGSIQISEQDFKTNNAFTAFVKYILDLLGIRSANKNAYDAIVHIANVLAKNYDAKEIQHFTEDYQVLSSLLNIDEPAFEASSQEPVSDDMSRLMQKFLDYINGLDWKDIGNNDIIKLINGEISRAKLSEEKRGWLKAFVTSNSDKIINRIVGKGLEDKGYKTNVEDLNIDNIIIPEFKGLASSGEDKINAVLNNIGKLWRAIAEKIGSTKENVEKTFFLMAKDKDVNNFLANKESFNEYLDSYEIDDIITREIIDSLRAASFSNIVSLFNFYVNLHLTKQYGLFYNKGSFSLKLLNPSQKYDDFVDSFKNTIRLFKYKDYQGYKALKFVIQNHNEEKDKLFQSKNNKDWSYYDSLSKEEREQLRREQHNKDLQLLSNITGISSLVWNQYFTQQTKETFAYSSKDAINESNYVTYDNLLANDTWRKGKDMMYRRIQSNLAFQLWQQTVNNKDVNFDVAFDNFFLRGNEDTGVMSNLYKLSTSISEKNEIGMSGYDIKHDRFNSFIQSSNVTTQAENILESSLDNNVVNYYKSIGEPMDIVILNGLKDISEKNKEGIESINLSSEDLWVSQLNLFFNDEDTYLHWLGQFGDKAHLMFAKVPKLIANENDITDLKKIFPDFEEVSNWIQKYIEKNQEKFMHLYKNVKEDREITNRNLARSFTYNFAKNIQSTNEIFFGSEKSYDSKLTKMVKRGGSSISPGYRLNPFVEGGVGETYRFALVNDKYSGLEDIFDGIEFMTGDYAKRTQVSMGSIFNKESIEEFKVLDSVKCLFSTVDPETNFRGITKGNRVNIDILADTFPGSKFNEIKKYMLKNDIDVLSFKSTTKAHEKVESKNIESQSIQLWDENGKVKKNPVIPEFGILTRKTSDVYVQQDLRHSATPKTAKMSSQMLSNVLMLDKGKDISKLLYDLQKSIISELEKELGDGPIDKAKIKWIEENVKENNQEELIRLIKLGMSPYEPAYNNYIRKMFSGILTKKALEIPINRVATQEIPDPEGLLKGRRLTKDGKNIILPDIIANIFGARYEDNRFEGKPDEAIAFVKANQEMYRDLLDENYNVKEWEITERNGNIPGELVICTRTPADDLHSHTVGRLKHRIKGGNFCMLDAKSRTSSGSDFDGDQRFIQTFYKDKNGKIINDNSKEGIANNIMLLIANDYNNPKFDEKINNEINTKFVDDIVDEYRNVMPVYSFLDPRGQAQARDENMVGVKMKGMITDMVTVYSLLADKKIPFKTNISIPIGEETINLTGIAADSKGYIKNALVNFLNMCFDNASDPKIEIIGFNEITAPMFTTSIIGNEELSNASEQEIKNHIQKIVKYFTSPLLRKFTEYMRSKNGALREVTMDSIKTNLLTEFSKDEVDKLFKFYYQAQELRKIRSFYSLTQTAPSTIPEYYAVQDLYESVKNNYTYGKTKEKVDFSLIDVKNLFDKNGNPIPEFAIAKDVLKISKDYIFRDSFEESIIGKQIINRILNSFDKNHRFSKDEISSISYGLNSIAILRALNIKMSAKEVETELLDNLNKYRNEYPDNLFLSTIQKVVRKGKSHLEIDPNYRHQKLNDARLKDIKQSFDEIFEKDDQLALKFATHAIMNWGAATTTSRGSYYSLFGDEFRVFMSEIMYNELYQWQNDELNANDKLDIMEIILRGSNIPSLKEKAAFKKKYSYYDIHKETSLRTNYSNEFLDQFDTLNGAQDFQILVSQTKIDATKLKSDLEEMFDKPISSITKDFKPAIKSLLEYRKAANRIFPINKSTDYTVKDMLSDNQLGELLSSEDESVSRFVYHWLQKKYPTVEIFKDREAFYSFVKKWGDKGFNINPEAIGHAFANAVFVDSGKSVQSTLFHEHTHIYWDALSDNDIAKKRIWTMFKEAYPDLDEDDLEERIVLDIAHASVNFSMIQFKGTTLQKFLELLKHFWRSIKINFGKYNKTDLVQEMMYDVWYNSEKIVPRTNYGESQIKNMVTYNSTEEDMPGFNGDTHTHFIGKTPVPSVTSVIGSFQYSVFNGEIQFFLTSKKEGRMYTGLTKEKLTKQDVEGESNALMKLWMETVQETGTIIHAVGEDVFGGKKISKNEIDKFESKEVYQKTRKIFEELKSDILALRPNATFITEKHIISKKYKLGGIADLIVDLGNGEIWIYDFKTTDKEFADDEGKSLPVYTKSYGSYKTPFSNLSNSKYNQHTLQLNIYANMIEEQENSSTPGEKNEVKKLFIIPIIREFKDNKISSVNIGNQVPIKRNEKTIDFSKRMMEISNMQRTNVNSILPEYRKNLLDNKTPEYLIDDMMKSYHFFQVYTGGLEKTDKSHIADIRHRGIEMFTSRLLTAEDSGGLGFSAKDLSGESEFRAEELFYVAYHGIKKSEYLGYERLTKEEEKEKGEGDTKRIIGTREKLFIDHDVYQQFIPIKNPKRTVRKWSRLGNNLLHEITMDQLKINDEIMAIYDIKMTSGKLKRHIYYYTVTDIDLKRNKIKVINQATKETTEINPPGWKNKDGILRIENELPKLISEPGENSFVPAYTYEVKKKTEKHWNITLDKSESIEEQSITDNNLRKIWAFFNQFSTWDELISFTNEEKNVNELFEKLNTIDNKIAGPLAELAREESVNHLFSYMIKREYEEHLDSPKYIMPQTLNLYYMLTMHKNVVWKDFDDNTSLRQYMNARMMSAHTIPLNMFSRETENQRREYIYESIQMSEKFKKFIGKNIDYDLIVNINKETGFKTWVFPDSVDINSNPLEREFLDTIYDYYEKYDPEYRDYINLVGAKQIPVGNIYKTRTEFIEKFGSKYGPAMYDKLSPQAFDNIKLKIVKEFAANNNPIYATDENNNEIILTLRQIKDLFIVNNDPIEMQKMLGSRWQQIMHIPGTKYTIGNVSAGMLNYYMKKAMRIYDKGGDELNEKSNVDQAKKKMSILGKSNLKYTTEKYVEATEKIIDSMLYAHHMKRLMGPLEWIYQQYTEGEDISQGGTSKGIATWIRVWGDYQLYKKKPLDHGILSGRTMSDLIDFANRFNSFNKIAFALKTDFNNLAVGQAMDIIHEPGSYFKGIQRIFENPDKIISNIKKAKSLSKKFGLVNIVNDAAFDMIDKEFQVFGFDITKLENAGYLPMEWAETLNQMPLFIGLMTQEEWDAYDNNGEIISQKNKLSRFRRNAITHRIYALHGDYGMPNAAPGYITNQGKAIMAFKKWLPSMIMKHLGKYQLDTDYLVRSGIIPTLRLVSKIIVYNNNRTQEKQDKTLQELEKIYASKEISDTFFSGTNEYFTLLQKEVNGGKITWANLSENDQRNIRAAIIEGLILSVGLLSLLGLLGDDDDKIYKPFYKRMFKSFFTRFRGDLMFVYDANNWEYMLKNPIPALSLLTGIGQFISDFATWSKYTQDEMIAKKGTPKWIVSSTYFLPGGSFIRQVQTRKRIFTLKHKYYDLREMNFSEEKIKELGFDDYKISKFDLIEQSYKWKRMYRDLMLAQKYYSLIGSGYVPGDIIDMELGIKLKENEVDEIQEAMQMITLQQMIDSGEIGLTMEQIITGATEMRKLEKSKKSRTDKKTEKEFEEAQEKFKN